MAKVFTGALAIIKIQGTPVGYMRNLRITEDTRRQPVRGLGTILPQEAPVVEWMGRLTCSFFEINYKESGLKNAIRRDVGVGNIASQIATGLNVSNFEDNLVLDSNGIDLDIYKKIEDVGSPDPTTGLIIPSTEVYAKITRCFIESDNINVDDGGISGRDQSFIYLDPIVFNP